MYSAWHLVQSWPRFVLTKVDDLLRRVCFYERCVFKEIILVLSEYGIPQSTPNQSRTRCTQKVSMFVCLYLSHSIVHLNRVLALNCYTQWNVKWNFLNNNFNAEKYYHNGCYCRVNPITLFLRPITFYRASYEIKKNVLKKIAEGIRRTCYCLLRICVLNKTIEIANPLTCCWRHDLILAVNSR